jgi:hypothetical protein
MRVIGENQDGIYATFDVDGKNAHDTDINRLSGKYPALQETLHQTQASDVELR